MIVTGSCAQRGPRSRFALLVARVSLLGGLCAAGWFGGGAVAEAVEPPDVERPRVEVTPTEPGVTHPHLDELRPELDELRPAERGGARPAVPEEDELRPSRPDLDEVEPAEPDLDEVQPAEPELPDIATTAPAAPFAAELAVDPTATPAAPTTLPPEPPRPDAAPRVELGAPPDRATTAATSDHPRGAAEPRAPDPAEPASTAPLDDSDHGTDAPSQPASGNGGGAHDLRTALVVLPTGPSLAHPSALGVPRPEDRPVLGTSSAEPSASPD